METIGLTLEDFEARMVAQLETELADLQLEIKAFPDNPENYKFLHKHGAILVHYRGALPDGEHDVSGLVHQMRVHWDVSVYAKDLRSHLGALRFVQRVNEALIDFKPLGASGACVPLGEEFKDRDGSTWLYIVRFAHLAPRISRRPIDTGAPFTSLHRIVGAPA